MNRMTQEQFSAPTETPIAYKKTQEATVKKREKKID